MRLIDADELKKWSEEIEYTFDGGIDINEFDRKLELMPTVDAVPVVRCRECKYLRLTGTVWRCTNRIVMMICEPDDYCSRGEKNETDSLHECG